MLKQTGSSRLAQVMKAVRREYPLLIVLSCLLNLLLLVSTIYMLQVYDRVLSTGSLDTLLWLTMIALFAIAIYGLLEQSRRMVLGRVAAWVDCELNAPVLKRAMEARLEGENLQGGIRDVGNLKNFYGTDAAQAFLDMPWSVIFLVFMWALHPAIGIVGTLGAALLFGLAITNDLLTREGQKRSAADARASQDNAIKFVDSGETIGPLGMARQVFENWRLRHSEIAAEQQSLQDKTTVILSLSRSVRIALQVAILGVGAYYVLAGSITAGAMIAGSITMGRALAPIERATAAWRAFVAARGAYANLKQLFERLDRDGSECVALPRPNARLSFDDIFYVPPGSTEPLLQGIRFAVEPGENCAVVGPSGSGKSTLCRLAVGAWKPAKGHVRLDGADVFDWHPADLGPYIGYLPQQVEFLPGTVAQNIARFREVDSAALVRAAQMAGVHELILALPAGYETDIALHSRRISQGQRQRLGLARALYGSPALVVLDEPNANLDEAGDKALIDALATLKQLQVTVLIVTHRASVLKCADKIAALDRGALAGFGPRDQIIRPVPSMLPVKLPVRSATPQGQSSVAPEQTMPAAE
ncbi:Alkaline protease secretion ATP-binding protein AprD [Mesorhizobium plurifarium]|uniref:Alkaline protease secretion ATP-binding protein AprD n=1 Tax=Mesorhizobium plurifarium TaxID=69974 RepID=A0A090F712_MESPL|nr:Alkaline protease secretion ATP-binding protein AprD [Mesorhizobium plurifarium]